MSDPTATTQEFYTRWAHLYDVIARRSPGVHGLREAAVDALALRPGDAVVEMGCGTGANFPYLRDRVGPAGTVVGVDFTPGMVGTAHRRIREEGWQNVHVVRGDATRPPMCDADAVLSTFVSGMLADPAAAVRTWAALVGSDGRLGLLDLARSTSTAGAALNALFRAFVRAGAPPGRRGNLRSPTAELDRRVVTAHRTLHDLCEDDSYRTRALGFARISGGTVIEK